MDRVLSEIIKPRHSTLTLLISLNHQEQDTCIAFYLKLFTLDTKHLAPQRYPCRAALGIPERHTLPPLNVQPRCPRNKTQDEICRWIAFSKECEQKAEVGNLNTNER